MGTETPTSERRRFWSRFHQNLAEGWRERLIVLALALAVGVASGELLNNVPLLEEANRAALTAVQKRLGAVERNTRSLTLVDLSSAIGLRKDVPIAPGETLPDGTVLPTPGQVEFQLQLECLMELLAAVAAHRPMAIFVDWQTTAPRALWDEVKGAWRPGTHPEFQETFARFQAKLDALAEFCPVFFVGDLLEDVVRARRKTAPGKRHDVALLSSELPKTDWYPYFPLATIQSGSGMRLPSLTDGLISFLELEDKVMRRPTKWGLFEATITVGNKPRFWIDYGFAPSLARNALFLDNTEWTDPSLPKEVTGRLAGNVVFIADLTRPDPNDTIPLPLDPEQMQVPVPAGVALEVVGSGGMAQACAFLTRTQEPLYALPSGPAETVLFAILNIAIAAAVWAASALLASVGRSGWNKSAEMGLELILLVGVTLLLSWYSVAWMADSRIMVPQVEGFLVTRFADTILLGVFLVIEGFRKATR